MIDKTCCFTGHRQLPSYKKPYIRGYIEQAVHKLADRGVLFFGCGGARGFDTLAAQAVINVRKTRPEIKLILVLPCRDQADGWPEPDMRVYESIKKSADKIKYTAERYYEGCMFKRNRHLVDFSSYCVCYLTQDTGGTAYTVEYARTMGLEIINLAEKVWD